MINPSIGAVGFPIISHPAPPPTPCCCLSHPPPDTSAHTATVQSIQIHLCHIFPQMHCVVAQFQHLFTKLTSHIFSHLQILLQRLNFIQPDIYNMVCFLSARPCSITEPCNIDYDRFFRVISFFSFSKCKLMASSAPYHLPAISHRVHVCACQHMYTLFNVHSLLHHVILPIFEHFPSFLCPSTI